ncbi:Pycsar system effector family protein [Vibrio cholerae]|nr:hypothetical protein [Vibrio vulnificus]
MKGESIDEILDGHLKATTDWLKFAEAKNGILIGVGSATLFGVFRLLNSFVSINIYVQAYLYFLLICIGCAVLIALLSFVPRLEPPFWLKFGEKEDDDNPFFFGHICKHSKISYFNLLVNNGVKSKNSKLDLALCEQVVNNAKIATIKFKMFSMAIYWFIAGLITPIGLILVLAFRE